MCNHVHSQEVEVSLSDWELGVASGLNEMKEKLSLCEVRQEEHVLYLMGNEEFRYRANRK